MEPKRILVADDHAVTRKNIARVLQEEGYVAVLAADGQEALSLISTDPPDLVLTDLKMPKADGLEVLTYVQQVAPHTPVILVTAAATPDVEEEVRQLGAQDFLEKPLNLDDLLRKIVRALAKRRPEQATAPRSLGSQGTRQVAK